MKLVESWLFYTFKKKQYFQNQNRVLIVMKLSNLNSLDTSILRHNQSPFYNVLFVSGLIGENKSLM